MKGPAYNIIVTGILLCVTFSQTEGAGRVFIGYPPFIDPSIPNPTEFVFRAHDVNSRIPVYIEAFNDTNPSQSVPITHNVLVSCELSFVAGGYSSGTFQSATLGASTNYSDVITSNFVSGRAASVRCFGDSQLPPVGSATSPPPQFTKETSWSDPLLFQVKPSPTVNFCENVTIVPDQYQVSQSTFELEFSEAVEGGIDNLIVTCSVQSIGSPAPELEIHINTTLASPKPLMERNESFVLLVVFYEIQTKGSPISVQCSGESITGNQYQPATSAGSPSQFELETGSVHLYPEYPEFIQSKSPTIQTLLSLDSPVADADLQVSFVCRATVENDTRLAMMKAETPDCSFVYDTDRTTTTLPMVTIDANSTLPPTDAPGMNLSLWEVVPSSFEIQAGGLYRSLKVFRTVDVNSTELELVLVTCCVPSDFNSSPKYVNKSAGLLITALLQPPTTNWTLATESSKAYIERTIANPAYVEIAPCACDVTDKACDVDCCCDKDCSADQKATFSSCIPGLIGGEGGPIPTYFCNSTHVNKPDWFPLMCVHFQSTANLGMYFINQGAARTVQSFYQKLFSVASGYSYRETDRRNVAEQNVSTTGYKYGQRLKTAQPTATGGMSPRSGVLSLPQRTIGGHCHRTAPVRFLKDMESDCIYQLTPDLCRTDSVLSARMYAEGTGLTNPPCPRMYKVLSVEDSSGKAISEAKSSYFCSPDNSGFLNTPDTVKRNLDPNTAWLFDYTLPTEECQDQFGNDICADPEDVVLPLESGHPRCSFDDGYTPAPLPVFNTTTLVCHNAVLAVRYNFTWSGQRVVFLNTSVVLGNLPMEITWQENRTVVYTDSNNITQRNTTLVDHSAQAILQQQYTVIFHHNYTDLDNTSDTSTNQESQVRVDRSGYPGYDAGKAVHSGRAIFNTTTDTFYYVNSNLSNQMTVFETGIDGLCYSAGKKQITFQDDMVSNCALRLDFDWLNNCTYLRKLIVNRLNSMMPADRLGRFGFLNSRDDGYWIPVIRQDLSEYFLVDPVENMTSDVVDFFDLESLTDQIQGQCHNVTTGIHLEVLYGETGKSLGASILEIVGAKISYSLETWELTCSGSNAARCYGSQTDSGESYVESFYVTTSVSFTKVPAQIPEEPIRFWHSYNEALCPQDTCWWELFYPLTEGYTGEEQFYVLIWSEVLVLGLVCYFLVTRPWW